MTHAQQDNDFKWLLSHIPPENAPNLHKERAQKVVVLINELIEKGAMPYTIGLFGTWGSGKTTFLAVLAEQIIQSDLNNCYNIIYFNAWKYAGFMEIVPSLIYKVLKYGCSTDKNTEKVIVRIMLSLGQDYSSKFGEWFENRFGVNPVNLIKDAQKIRDAINQGIYEYEQLLDTYYTQVDQAQDLLQEVFKNSTKTTIVLIDELDRCDPDEAFAVIKQLRVFFAMREIPVIFVLCANPEPIGLAIKHRYGLDSPGSDYEARRILEKFVDIYLDLSEPVRLPHLIQSIWRDENIDVTKVSAISYLDEVAVKTDFYRDTVQNATVFQAINTGISLYSNIRLLRKSLQYVCSRDFPNKHLIWTAWHLEIAEQMEPLFRKEISYIATEMRLITERTYQALWQNADPNWILDQKKMTIQSNHGGTLFGLFRSLYWDNTKKILKEIQETSGPESLRAQKIINELLSDYRKMDFVISLSLLPVRNQNLIQKFVTDKQNNFNDLSAEFSNNLMKQFGWLLANY